ncbi:MAG: hypothetical protein ABIZ09_04820, partial [Rhodoferax sp.]
MEGNRSKPAESDQAHLSAAQALLTWLRQEGGNQRIPQVLTLLAENTVAELKEGRGPPASEVEALAQQHADVHGGSLGANTAGRWLRRSEVEKWWNARRPAIEQACRRAGVDWLPLLAIKAGGGRSNSTEYRLEFAPLEDAPESDTTEPRLVRAGTGEHQGTIQYQVDPARTSLWVRWLSTTPQFHISSWRGRLLVAMILCALGWVLVNWFVACLSLWPNHPFSSRDLLSIVLAAVQTWLMWHIFGPLSRLPWHRVTLAPDLMLSSDQMHGQFRLIRDTKKKTPGGWFSVVRHWGTCPICSADVDIRSGSPTFPGRLVGRCSDSPLEHVFSFDPVTLIGVSL